MNTRKTRKTRFKLPAKQKRTKKTNVTSKQATSPSITFRANNEKFPRRKEDFVDVLNRRGANATDVLNHCVDAYIACDGQVTFPVTFVCDPPKRKVSGQ